MKPHDYIPKPCHENWNAMSGDEKRKFCDRCSNQVHDLTGKSDQEITEMHRENGGKLCGSFRLKSSLALGTGIATLALASCSDPQDKEPPLVGMICPPPEQKDLEPKEKKPEKKAPVTPPKRAEKIEPPILLGKICVPDPDKFPQA